MMTFQRKMIFAFLVFVLLPILTIGFVSNRISTKILQDTISGQTVQTLKVLDRNMMAAVTEVNHFSDYVVSSGEIQSFLKSKKEETIFELYSARQSIAGMLYANAGVQQFALYSNTGAQLYQSNNQSAEEGPFFPERLLQEMREKKGSAVWLSPAAVPQHPFQQHQSLFLTQGRIINDVNSLDPLGYILLSIRLDLFDNVFMSESELPSTELLINKDGKILYAVEHQLIGKKLAVNSLKQVQSGETGFLMDEWNGEKHLITYMPSRFQLSGDNEVWIVSLKPWHALSSEIVYIRNTTFLLGLLALLAAVFFNVFYLRRIAGFIQALNCNMKKVENGDLSARMHTYSLKELAGLSFSFNQMIHRIGELIQRIKKEEEKSRQAEFKVLQQQINPHFLYNTLESINALAAMSGQKDISKMTINLGRLLRISINGKYEVPVQREISHVVSYLEIQKVRFDHAFTYEVDIDDSLANEPVLKLILQPLVENILAHAFDQQENGLISIRGTQTRTTGFFWVRDNGTGIPADALRKLHKKREESEERGHGIRNVHERLNLYYGKKYGLMVCSSEEGTIIQLSFPLKRGDEQDV